MNEDFEHIDDLIAKVVAGEATPEEVTSAYNWKKLSAENTAYFDDAVQLIHTIDGLQSETSVDVNAAWKKMDQRISSTEGKVIPLSRATIFLRVAAAIVSIVAFSYFMQIMFNKTPSQPIVFASSTKMIEQKLPDSSTVFLNKGSEISFVVNEDNEREVTLTGEAFFEVVHDEEQPFIITVGDLIIKDIGTAFNVKAIPESNLVEVLVQSGEVHFYSKTSDGLYLTKGEKALYDKTEHTFSKSTIDLFYENTTSYVSGKFRFNKTKLGDVVSQLNDVYETNIQLSDDIVASKELSVEFDNEELDLMLDIIAETLDLEMIKSDDIILLQKERH